MGTPQAGAGSMISFNALGALIVFAIIDYLCLRLKAMK
jgi:hypothetical protein